MSGRSLVLVCAFLAGTGLSAQGDAYTLPEAARIRLKSLGSGEHLLITERRFGFDSSHVQVLHADGDWSIAPLSARRFPDYLWFLFDAAPAPNGMVVTGTLTSSYQPQLHRVNDDGSLAWAKSFSGMTGSQTRIAMLFADGADHYGYTNADGFFGGSMYRVEGEETGTTFNIVNTTVPDLTYRMYAGTPAEVPENHVLGGSGVEVGSGDYDAVLAHFSTTGCSWMKRIELNGDGLMEEVEGVVRLTGGGYAVAMSASGTPYSGFLLKVDDSGALQSCVRIDDPTGVWLSALVELQDGSLLLSGFTTSGTGMLYKVTAGNTLAWARNCASCFYNFIGSFYRDGSNELLGLTGNTVFMLQPDGDACGYVDVGSVTLTPFTPVITDHTVVNDPAPPVTVASMTLQERVPVGSSSLFCVGAGIGEGSAIAPLAAHPVPTSDIVNLGSPGQVAWNEQVELRDLAGAVLRATIYRDGIDLRAFAPGTYLITLPRTGQRAIVLRR